MEMIRKAALLLALVLLLGTAALAAGATTTTETIGGAAAQVVYVTPGENTEIRAVIANGQLGTTAKAEAVIAGEGKRLVAAVNGPFAPRAQITREQAVITVMNAWRKLG